MGKRLFWLLAALPLGEQILAPRVSIDADGAMSMTLYRGRPLFVNGVLTHAQRAEATPAILLSPKDGGWMDALKIVVQGADGQEQSWPLMALGMAEAKSVSLVPKSRVPLSWLLASSATSSLATGTYPLRLTLSISESAGWNGSVESAVVTVQVEDEPAQRLRSSGLGWG